MESFSITCTTCKSRLKVRSAAAIGQVVPCPKCGGMILVKLPEDVVSPEVASAATKPVEQQPAKASPHNTKDFDDVDSILAGNAPAAYAAVPRSERPAAGSEQSPAPHAPEAAAIKAAATATPAENDATSQPLPHENTVAAEAVPAPNSLNQTNRYGTWLAISILAGTVMAVAVVVVSGSFFRDDRGRRSEVGGQRSEVRDPQAVVGSDFKGENLARTTSSEESGAKIQKSEVGNQASAPITDVARPTPNLPSAIKPSPAEPDGDPLGFVTPSKAATTMDKAPPAIGDDPLGRFSDVLQGASASPLPPAAAPTAADRPTNASPVDEATARPSLPRPPARTVNVAARLADPLPGIAGEEVPLADFLDTISALSTVPVTLEPDGLALVKATASSPVTVRATNTTVGQALASALRPLALEYVVEDDQLTVTLAEPPAGKLRELTYPVDDLTGGKEEQAHQLAECATALIDPDAWKDGEENGPSLTPGSAEFAVQASNRTHARLFLFFEKLRVARGLPPRSRYDPTLFRLPTRTAKVRETLAMPITLNYRQPTLLVRILDRLEESAQVRILVDWRALAAQGWNPDGEGTLVALNKPLSEALDELLSPMDLAWRAVDEHTLQVTSLAALQQTSELEFHPAQELAVNSAAGDVLLARLRSALAAPGTEESEGVLRFDPASRCILASLPQPQQRQVERLLAEWATEAKAAAK